MEKTARAGASPLPRQRFIDIEFALHCALCTTHSQRIASEFRVPVFQVFTMPPTIVDSETAALYKQLLLRPLGVSAGEEPEDVRLVRAFAPLCSVRPTSTQSRSAAGATAFTQNWVAFAETQGRLALEARYRHMHRYEWPSLWESAEVHDELARMQAEEAAGGDPECVSVGDPEICHDKDKPRATVEQYVALVGEDVATNLEGVARASREKRPRQYQSDAAIHHAYMRSTVGGGDGMGDGDQDDVEAAQDSVKPASAYFEPLPWGLVSEE